MKTLCDIEAIHTYEGSHEINTLVAGREMTGLSAFKWKLNYFKEKLVFYQTIN